MVVTDASVAAKWFVAEPGHEVALQLTVAKNVVIASDLVLLETMNVVRPKLRSGILTQDQLSMAVTVLPADFDRLVPAAELLTTTLELAKVLDHSVHDCAYLACALACEAHEITADDRFAVKAVHSGHGTSIRRLGAL